MHVMGCLYSCMSWWYSICHQLCNSYTIFCLVSGRCNSGDGVVLMLDCLVDRSFKSVRVCLLSSEIIIIKTNC